MRNTKVMSADAVFGGKMWLDSEIKFETIPASLEGSTVFPFHKNICCDDSIIYIRTSEEYDLFVVQCKDIEEQSFSVYELIKAGWFLIDEELRLGDKNYEIWKVTLCGEFLLQHMNKNSDGYISLFVKKAVKSGVSVTLKRNVVCERTQTKEGSKLWTNVSNALNEYPDFLNGSTIHQITLDVTSNNSDITITLRENSMIYIAQETAKRRYVPESFHKHKFKRITERKHKLNTIGISLDDIWYRHVKVLNGKYETLILPSVDSTTLAIMAIFTTSSNQNSYSNPF